MPKPEFRKEYERKKLLDLPMARTRRPFSAPSLLYLNVGPLVRKWAIEVTQGTALRAPGEFCLPAWGTESERAGVMTFCG